MPSDEKEEILLQKTQSKYSWDDRKKIIKSIKNLDNTDHTRIFELLSKDTANNIIFSINRDNVLLNFSNVSDEFLDKVNLYLDNFSEIDKFYQSLGRNSNECVQLLQNNIVLNKEQLANILDKAITSIDICTIKNLIKCCADIVKYYDEKYEHITFPSNYKENFSQVIELLINHGLNINKRNKIDVTILRLSCALNYINLVKILIDKGADLDVQGSLGFTALMRAIDNDKTECALLLINNKANLDLCASNGDTALIIAVRKNNKVIIRALLNNGARKDILNNDLQSAKDIAEILGFKDIALKLGDSNVCYVPNVCNGPNVYYVSNVIYGKFFIIMLLLMIIFKIF
jgi:ankyrin repeat protein